MQVITDTVMEIALCLYLSAKYATSTAIIYDMVVDSSDCKSGVILTATALGAELCSIEWILSQYAEAAMK
jgi:hypothetical protein